MTIFIFLLIVLAIVTLVGHLIWVVLAWIGRLIFFDSDYTTNDEQAPRIFDLRDGKLNDLATTERLVVQFYSDGKLREDTYEELMKQLRAERASLSNPHTPVPKPAVPRPIQTPPSVVSAHVNTSKEVISIKPVPSFMNAKPEPEYQAPPLPTPRKQRRSFSEVLNSFMEESNIRWGEIIGGLLIIGCSTALVVSLWPRSPKFRCLSF